MIARVGDNTYKFYLPGNYGVSASFNVVDFSLLYFDIGNHNSRTSSFQEREFDTNLVIDHLAQGLSVFLLIHFNELI